MRGKAWAGAALGVALVFTATPASADPTPKPKDLGKRAKQMCARADRAVDRVDRLITRFEGDAKTRGSVAWMNDRAAKVRAKDPARADIIAGRAKIRQSRLATLKLRKQNLPKVQKWCTDRGFRK
ncbi:hypothetical protein DPM19_29830 [Actinomadura craniellae]|uniref:Secreted protein n=1 Tax=Actinomadura craniellae TaxID=2231787 RepID=A0A365GXE3_9ACTN|nr:hypothetical protein [Actinomadura craniellae]RAY11507.1 hypothetical protein DPM19_29830 [Actinomadura craniellae]